MVNIKIPVSGDNVHWIIINNEILTAIDKNSDAVSSVTGQKWTPYVFTENRFSLYYRRKLHKMRADFDIGLMDQYWREVRQAEFTTSYNVMLDLIIYEPFGRHRRG
jgi:hypothetical protein